MNCSENEYVCSVKKENNLGFYRLHTIWKEDGFLLNVTSKDGAWRGELTPNDVKNMSSQLDLEPKSYLQNCKDTLTTHDGYPGMTYSVENGSFTWKKIVDEDSGIKIKMGSVRLTPASFVDTIQNLVQVALDCNKKMQEKLKKLSSENNKILLDKGLLLQKLNQLIETKETMENDLYSRFILLLNSKKKKILELETAFGESKRPMGNVSTSKEGEIDEKNAYEVDTENDDYDLEAKPAEKKFRKSRVKSDQLLKTKKKARRKNSFSPGGCKKTKKLSPDDESGDDILDFSNDIIESPPPKLSPVESCELGSAVKTESEMPCTKDELLNFFYGESSHET